MSWLERLWRRRPGPVAGAAPAVQFEAALRAVDAGSVEAALDIAARLESSGAVDLAAFIRAQCASRAGDGVSRIAHLRHACQAAPHEESYAIELALALGDGGDAAGATTILAPLLGNEATEAAHTALLHFRLAGWRHACGDTPNAMAALRRALELEPHFAQAAHNLAELEVQEDGLETARATLRRAASTGRHAGLLLQRALMLPPAYASQEHIDATRADFDADVAALTETDAKAITRPEEEVGRTPFGLAYQGRADRDSLMALSVAMRRHYPAAAPKAPLPARSPGGRRRIGLVSAYFRRHSVGRAFVRLVERLRGDDVEIHLFSVGSPPVDDPLAARFRAAADHFTVLPADVAAAAHAIAQQALDLLLFPELGMDPFTWFLAYWRMAPVQCACAGHPDTTGIDTVDCFLSDAAAEPPDAPSHYSERLVAVDGMFLPLDDLPEAAAPPRSACASIRRYLCAQTLIKLHPDFDAMIGAILAQDRSAEVAIFTDPDQRASELVARRMRSALGSSAGRLRFIPRMDYRDYLAHLRDADVVLDTPHFGGGNTTLEALGLGVPVVTWPGHALRGRFASARLSALGLRDCIAEDRADYAERAVAIARDPQRRRSLHEHLRAGRGTLAADGPARCFAKAVRAMIGLPASESGPAGEDAGGIVK